MKERRANRSADQIVADLEAKIVDVKARDARRKAKARPEVQLALVAQRALNKAHGAATEHRLRIVLSEIGQQLASVLDDMAVVAQPSDAVAARRRGRGTANS